MAISNYKFAASILAFLPALILVIIYVFLFGNSFCEWILAELLSYNIQEWVVIFLPPLASFLWLKKSKIISAIALSVAMVFVVDIFRFSNDPTKDVDIVFYFGVIVRIFTITSFACPLMYFVAKLVLGFWDFKHRHSNQN